MNPLLYLRKKNLLGSIIGEYADGVRAVKVKNWSPAQLFANNETGMWYDPSDLSSLFQDSAGTVPVTGHGQPVGLMKDKSGHGVHLLQTNNAKRPVLEYASGRYSLHFTAASSMSMISSAYNLDGKHLFVCNPFQRHTSTAQGHIAEFTVNSGATAGGFVTRSPHTAAANTFGVGSNGGTFQQQQISSITNNLNLIGCLRSFIDGASSTLDIFADDDPVVTLTANQGTGTFANAILSVGARNNASLFYDGLLYGLIIRGTVRTDDATVRRTIDYMNAKLGVF